ncbi:hypothetical protein EDB81DRAFT_849424 [Dactylonectria macrodidyma]|uniref:Phytanoyl-CoA dioxygenase n=1 Tax=Dactylonectria macrodidyma TaxID=307937 RepID=A0A9P9I728_9HYPO|nr:hypothetical protein EDB81DRAFT_849424 [Dactylonectria macrodidyma]
MRGHPQPTDPSYEPTTSVASISADAPIGEILAIPERDGGWLCMGIDIDVKAHQKNVKSTENSALHIIPIETLAVPGLVGKTPTVAKICEFPVLEQLRTHILKDEFSIIREDYVEENAIDPLLSVSITLHIGYGASRQRLHRDDNVHGIRHEGKFELSKASQFACLIAGTKTTRQNGATMFIPGSHKWDDSRTPQLNEICFAEMEQGSALIFLASCYHGGGHNSVLQATGTMRTEENQFWAVPHSKALIMSDKMLSLIGYKKPTTVLGIVENNDPALDLLALLKMVTA